MDTDSNGYITHVEVGGKDTWFMLGYYSVSEGCFLPYDAASGSEKEWLQNYQILQYNTIFDAEERCSIFCVTEGEIR